MKKISATPVSRRQFVQGGSMALAATLAHPGRGFAISAGSPADARALPTPLNEFGYGSVTLASAQHEAQRLNTHNVLMNMSEDSLLKPLRQMVGLPAPGEDLGGWYHYDPDWAPGTDKPGFAPAHAYGQWVSALARNYAITGDPEVREKVLRINRLYVQTIAPAFYTKNRFPAYCYDKIVCGLIDSHLLANDPDAFAILDQTTKVAAPLLPGRALDRDKQADWRPSPDESWRWDESYTMSENLFLAYQRGAGPQYRDMAFQYLDDETYFKPLARGEDVLGGKHAYSYVNALSSGMQAYLVGGSTMHLHAVQNAFALLQEQSFATGGWGPDERLRARNSGEIGASLEDTHQSFETPCGSYAHFKVTRYLLRATGDSRYGDSMERVMYNTILGVKPLEPDGHAFYYADYNQQGSRVYFKHRWPCCSGSLPQVAADYRILAYFRAPQAVYVNLYIPSTLQWQEHGTQLSLTQTGNYPLDSQIAFELTASQPIDLTLQFRIPQWAEGASLRVNGKRTDVHIAPGNFAAVSRTWRNGDRVEMEIPLPFRVEAVDAQHADTIALLRGPLVLFAVTEKAPAVTRQQLLSAQQTNAQEWQVQTANGALSLVPFTALGDRSYVTYLKAT